MRSVSVTFHPIPIGIMNYLVLDAITDLSKFEMLLFYTARLTKTQENLVNNHTDTIIKYEDEINIYLSTIVKFNINFELT